jgi:DNA polymerase elongation subunit (family B)
MIGYRNAVYIPQDECMKIYSWDENGNRISFMSSYQPYLMLEDMSGKDVSIFNTKLRKRTFKTQFDRSRFVKECGSKRLFENINPVQQHLIDMFWQHNQDEDFAKFPVRVVTIDIEVYSPDEFPAAEYAKHPINIITIHDSLTNQFFSWGTTDYKHNRSDLKFVHCATERQLLVNFIEFFSSLECDLLTGWNSAGFDIPYIINRINNILSEEYSSKLSPVGRVYCRTLNSGIFGKPQIRWYIDGVSCVDYIDIYKRFSFTNRESYKLDYIAELELGERKVDYGNTNLASLAKEDWQLFVDYNLQDVALLVKMDLKLQYVPLLRMLAYMGLTTMENAMSTLSTITGTAAIRARQRSQFLPTFVRDGEGDKNPGAFVAEPMEGFQSNVVSFDANSLYPNIMISLNLSPETKVGNIIDTDDKNVTIKHINGQVFNLPLAKFAQFVNQEKIAITKAKVLFSQKVKGILPEIVDEYYKERVAVRKEMMKLKKAKSDNGDVQDKIIQLNAKQLCIKIFINSVYGYMGNKNAPLGDDDIASSITLTGQYIIKTARSQAREYTASVLGNNNFPDIAVAGDTDSVYLCIEPLLKKYNEPLLINNKVNSKVHEIIDGLNVYINNQINTKLKDELNSLDPRIVFKRESIIDKGLFLEKKRYVAHVVDDEGIECDKWKYVGVEVVRTSMPKAIKPYVKKIIETMLDTRDRIKTNAVVNEAYDVFKALKPEEVAYVMGIKDLDKHASKAKEFSLPKGAPVHVKSAHNYNVLLKKLDMTAKYEAIQSGDKIRWMYIATPNKYGVETIAFKYYYPTEFHSIFKPAYEKMFEKIVFSVVERFYTAVKWPAHKPTEQMYSDLFDLFG